MRVLAQVKGVRQAVGRDVGQRGGDVRYLVQPVVEAVETREDVAQYVDVGGRGDLRRVEVGDVLGDGEAERLVGGEDLCRR